MITFSDVTKRYGSRVLYQNANLSIFTGNRIGLVGPNGAGKTTIFRLLTGEETPDGGTVNVPPKLVLGYFSQNVGEMSGRSVLEEVKTGAGRVYQLAQRLEKIEKQLQESELNPLPEDTLLKLVEEYSDVQLEFEQHDGYNLETRAKAVLTGLGIAPEDHHRAVEQFSGGWKMRVALAKILVLNPDVLLMDEPTNHLDVESIVWLENWLSNFKNALVMTSHDRDFMNRLVTQIAEVTNGALTVYSGNYDFYEREREVRREQLIAAHKRQQDMLAKEEEFIAKFAARASHAPQVQSRVKKLDKIERIELPEEQKKVRFDLPLTPRSGDEVVRFENLGKSWEREDGTEKSVFQGITGMIKRLDKTAAVGVNGAGKSTFLKTLAGETAPSHGTVQIGTNVKLGYFSQNALDVLNPQATVVEEMQATLPTSNLGVLRNILGAFLFSGDEVYKKVSVLSGGEKSRLVLAKILSVPVNFLILDEPTNHLDIQSREILLEALQRFEGSMLIVSHDRHFLRSLVTRVFEIDHGKMTLYPGNYEHYLSKKNEALH